MRSADPTPCSPATRRDGPRGTHGTEPWSQGVGSRRGTRRFMRRIAALLGLLFLLLFSAMVLAVVLATAALGGTSQGVRIAAGVGGAAVFILGLVFIGRSVRRMAGPIGEVMEAADRVAEGDYSARVSARGPGEVRRLGRAFNEMTARLQASDAERRRLLADVTHELRTPLSVIRGNLEGISDGVYAPDEQRLTTVLEETRVMARLLDDLQMLSTADAGPGRKVRMRRVVGDVPKAIEVQRHEGPLRESAHHVLSGFLGRQNEHGDLVLGESFPDRPGTRRSGLTDRLWDVRRPREYQEPPGDPTPDPARRLEAAARPGAAARQLQIRFVRRRPPRACALRGRLGEHD